MSTYLDIWPRTFNSCLVDIRFKGLGHSYIKRRFCVAGSAYPSNWTWCYRTTSNHCSKKGSEGILSLFFFYFARQDFVCSPMTTIYNLHVTHLNQPTYWIQQSKLAEKKIHLAHNIITYMFRNHSCMDQVHLVQARLNTITSSFHTVHSWGCVYALIELYTG